MALLAACTATPSPPPSPTATRFPTQTPSATPVWPTPTPKLTAPSAPAIKPTDVPPATSGPTPFASPAQTPTSCAPDQQWVEPLPHPLPPLVRPEPPRRVPNAVRSFWVIDGATGERRQITARLRVLTEHVAMWVEQDVWHDVRRLEQSAELFGKQIYPRTRAAFGSEWTPGIDNDPHIHILHAIGLGENVLGYTAGIDEYPGHVYPLSNEAEMITVNVDRVDAGSPVYHAMLARQFQRLIQWHQDRNEERWLKEGLAELAAALNGFGDAWLPQAYLEQTDTSLIAWTDSQSQRGASYLLAAYFHQRFGDAGTRILTSEPANGIPGIDAALDKLGTDLVFEDLFADWLAANILDSATEGGSSPYANIGIDLDRPAPANVYDDYPIQVAASAQQFGADYIVLRGDTDLRVQFTGQRETPLLSTVPHSGQYAWWSNRADESLSTLTRAFDLSRVKQATLTYWTWYDLEPHYDYAWVEVSNDGGRQWHTLSTPSGTDVDPYGNSPAWSYTGTSGGWIREEVDLSDYAGEDVLVRFSYLTDEAITGEGLLLDDISLPELDHEDRVGASTEGWTAQGFLITDGRVPQRYLALLIGGEKEKTVERLPLGEGQLAEWTVPMGSGEARELVLVVAAMAPLTAQSAPYQLSISR
jgi:immune inhibitor A